MSNPEKIYCPQCGHKVGTWDGKSTIDVVCVCRNCNKQVIYRIATKQTEIKQRMPRPSSGCMNFNC